MLERTPQSMLKEATDLGESTHKVIERLIKEARHPLMYLRRAQGILRLGKRYSDASLEEACVFFVEAALSDIRVRSIEQVIAAKSKHQKELKVERKPNENLRGQLHWAEIYH
jgi:hypothetical protein